MTSNHLLNRIPFNNSKLNLHNLLCNNKRKVNLTKIIKRKSVSRSSLKNLSFNNVKKNNSSSIDYNETPLKKNMNISLSNHNKIEPLSNITISFKPKEIMPKSTKYFEINNYCFKNEKSEENPLFSKIDVNRLKKIRIISFNLETSLNQLNINEENETNILLLYKKYLAYFIALEDYIKLINSFEEKNLLNDIKIGIDNLFNVIGKINQNLLLQNSRLKRENDFKNSLKKTVKINPIEPKYISSKKIAKKNTETNLNFSDKISDDSDLNYSDLESIRFNDKIEMKRINSFNSIPKLNLKIFNSLSTKNFVAIKDKDNNPKHKKSKIQYILNPNCFPVI